VTSSSYYYNPNDSPVTIAKPYEVFKGGNAINGYAYTNWWGGGAGSVGYASITEYSLGYTQNPYAADGVYQGGGSATNTFSTTYYTNGDTTATASGEWIQISTPYNMRLTSYSTRSRFTNSRLPVQYVILGSLDGSSNWYALDVVDIGTAASYSPLKKYTINTTTYPYSGNYYSHFRYVIQKLDTKADATVKDKQYAHENQWNLVGSKQVINQDVVYIGGLSSPIKSYFTDYIINVPTIDGSLNKYAGNYAVTSSSVYDAFWAPFKLFDNSFTYSPATTEYSPGWHSAGVNVAYKPMTNQVLSYVHNPYDSTLGVNVANSTGVYVGSGNVSTTFSTTYFTTGNTTATASGEWVQIFVPYNMKLISYSNLSRYKYTRLPVKYVILGSTDGSSNWYALDVVDIGSWDKYIPLKKYNINTTTYPYANNYYCFFRYVIQKIDVKPGNGDRGIVNESQWNLVGIKEPINQNYLYIGGKNSPINSYFTNYIVNVPTGEGVDKYAGSYEITSSSILETNNTFHPYNIFKGGNTLSGYEYQPSWSAAANSSSAFKPITNEALNYTQPPYDGNGNYRGGGTASKFFSTEYYTNGNTKEIASGEWVQINVPYNMKLSSYSARSRFTNFRLPVQYAILGSNDGSTWYAVDVVDIGSWDKYIPLKKFTINTTTYTYANNYYSFFRYVIKKIDSSPTANVTDKFYANENQWNLVGIKETPNANVGKRIRIGADSPTGFTSYFTSNSVTIPSNFVSPEYVGTYTVRESSTLDDTIYSGANLFRNDGSNNGSSYSVMWHAGIIGSARINGNVVTYNRQPYADGLYQGTDVYNFATPYYETSNSTYSSPGFRGEWVQIKLPFKLKLTGYSHRTRYLNIATLGRNPTDYRIFGSNDGNIWYTVDTQITGTTTLNTINIDTSTYPDGKHGYSYFRWVINKISAGSAGSVVANENQWNLIGIRTT
jgi:hypothetical protein